VGCASCEYPAHRDRAGMNGTPMMSLVRQVVIGPPALSDFVIARDRLG
jgi:hypothetical protein